MDPRFRRYTAFRLLVSLSLMLLVAWTPAAAAAATAVGTVQEPPDATGAAAA